MNHDFVAIHGGKGGPCDNQGFMSYGKHASKWSKCSKSDFTAHYNKVLRKYRRWCLPRKYSTTKYKLRCTAVTKRCIPVLYKHYINKVSFIQDYIP